LKERGSEGHHPEVLILGAGRMCEPAVKYLSDGQFITRRLGNPHRHTIHVPVDVVLASLFLEDAEKVVEGIPNATAAQLDVSDGARLRDLISEANVVISLLPANCHIPVANACIELKKHLVTASYVSSEMALLDDKAKQADVALLCEMGLDPGIGLILFFFFFFSTLKQIRFSLLLQQINWLPLLRQIPY
jgi:alpha-aminoadipic semialdehyde synthase